MKKKTVAVGMSGGVDSSLTAAMLMEQGYDVKGVMMRVYDPTLKIETPPKTSCFGPGEDASVEAAMSVAEKLGVELQVIDLVDEFRAHIIEYFKREYLSGRTPNPCVMCNRWIKFGFMVDKALDSGMDFDYFATGHYARIDDHSGRPMLRKAKDFKKDQTYFLAFLNRDQLERTLFPLGNFTKPEVRQMAKDMGLPVAERKESQDFMGGNYKALFDDCSKRGEIVDTSGGVLGKHDGLFNYTIGQRKGLVAVGKPIYVVSLDPVGNRVVVGSKDELYAQSFIAGELNNVAMPLAGEFRCHARIRQQHRPAPATVTILDRDKFQVSFDEPQLSITPGQSVVLYDDEYVLGAGVIEGLLQN